MLESFVAGRSRQGSREISAGWSKCGTPGSNGSLSCAPEVAPEASMARTCTREHATRLLKYLLGMKRAAKSSAGEASKCPLLGDRGHFENEVSGSFGKRFAQLRFFNSLLRRKPSGCFPCPCRGKSVHGEFVPGFRVAPPRANFFRSLRAQSSPHKM